jgi:hypothetical protein
MEKSSQITFTRDSLMNYQLHYNRLIDRAKNRVLEGYVEKHHIIPTCLGGSNEASNKVKLTASEHYVAHQLLVKLNPGNAKIIYAALAMGGGSNKKVKRCNNKIFSWLRKQYSAAMSIKMQGNTYSKGQTIKPHQMAILRLPKSEIHKSRISAGNKGKTKGIPRGPQSPEHKQRIGEARAKAWALLKLQKEV